MNTWSKAPSLGCFVYFERPLAQTPEIVRRLFRSLLEGLQIDPKQITKERAPRPARPGSWIERGFHMFYFSYAKPARPRRFSWKAVDDALADPKKNAIVFISGTYLDLHLSGELQLRPPDLGPNPVITQSPRVAWFVAETGQWPVEQLTPVLREWLVIAAEHGEPLSGGIFAAADLRRAKMEASLVYETDYTEILSPSEFLYRERLHRDDASANQIRRLYPVTLLGPAFARQVDPVQLRAAGAVDVTPIRDSLLVQAYPSIIPAWDPAFLAGTIEQRRLLWSLTQKQSADAAGLNVEIPYWKRERDKLPKPPFKGGPALHMPPDQAKYMKEVQAEMKREQREFEALLTSRAGTIGKT